LLFDYDILRLNLSCRAIDKLNIQAAECAMMSDDDEPIKLDDIRVKINDSPKHDDKQKSNGFASQFKKI